MADGREPKLFGVLDALDQPFPSVSEHMEIDTSLVARLAAQ